MNPRHADYDSAALFLKDISFEYHGLSWRTLVTIRSQERTNGRHKKAKNMEYARPARTPAALSVLKKVNSEGALGWDWNILDFSHYTGKVALSSL